MIGELIALVFFVVVMLLIFNTYSNTNTNEGFITVNNLNENNKKMITFCKRLKKYDRPSEHTLMLKNFRKRKMDKNAQIISKLMEEIKELQTDTHMSSVKKINDYKCMVDSKARKQMSVIDKAKENLENRNSVILNINPV
jgi:hypothetical protein